MSQNLNFIPRPNPAAINQDDRLMKFLETSQDLLSLVQHENAILIKEGILSFEAYIARKMELMQGFEKEAQNLLTTISAENGSLTDTQLILAGEIKRIRDALHVNSVHQIQMLRKKTLREATDFNAAEAGTESLCH